MASLLPWHWVRDPGAFQISTLFWSPFLPAPEMVMRTTQQHIPAHAAQNRHVASAHVPTGPNLTASVGEKNDRPGQGWGTSIWSAPATRAGGTRNPIHLGAFLVASFYVDNFVWPASDVINTQGHVKNPESMPPGTVDTQPRETGRAPPETASVPT